MRPGTSLEDYLEEFIKLLEDLLPMHKMILETYNAFCLVHSLLDEYNHLITTLVKGRRLLIAIRLRENY